MSGNYRQFVESRCWEPSAPGRRACKRCDRTAHCCLCTKTPYVGGAPLAVDTTLVSVLQFFKSLSAPTAPRVTFSNGGRQHRSPGSTGRRWETAKGLLQDPDKEARCGARSCAARRFKKSEGQRARRSWMRDSSNDVSTHGRTSSRRLSPCRLRCEVCEEMHRVRVRLDELTAERDRLRNDGCGAPHHWMIQDHRPSVC